MRPFWLKKSFNFPRHLFTLKDVIRINWRKNITQPWLLNKKDLRVNCRIKKELDKHQVLKVTGPNKNSNIQASQVLYLSWSRIIFQSLISKKIMICAELVAVEKVFKSAKWILISNNKY